MKILSKIVIIIFVFLAGFWFGQKYESVEIINDDVRVLKEELSANLTLDFGDGEIKKLEAKKIDKDSTVFSLLQNVSEVESIDLKYKDYGAEMGIMIESIGGVENNLEAGKYWQYWINGEYAKVGVGAQLVDDGDEIEWKYVEGQF